ncbi:MAG: tRNA threonylcarbamoyladenosine dehydratase [Bacilli bacterium]|nr:tRNA threonylcarbamoyladenosine dehydratase [Bacilli bacterium]
MFDRLESLIGKEKMKLIASQKILVFGVGGVGGYVVESLVRSGISKITIVDCDKIEKSNLNRQIIALNSTLGKYKVDVMRERVIDINPNIEIEALKMKVTIDNLDSFVFDDFDYIVDAIDDVAVKVKIAKKALEKNVKLVMSTGTAKKLDPSKLCMTTLNKTSYDPLARVLRRELREYDTSKLVVLASTEEPLNVGNTDLGSSVFVPSSGGLMISSHIIRDIIKDI